MIETLLRPWRSAQTWRSLVHTVLGLPIGMVSFVPTLVLLILSVVFLLVLPLAAVPFTLLSLWGRWWARVERSRVNALHGLGLVDPVPPLPPGPVWRRLSAAVRSRARWKEIGHVLARLPLSVASCALVLGTWCGSAALVLLPAYVDLLPRNTAQFGLFGVSQGPAAIAAVLVGVLGLAVVAPWLTLVAGAVDAAEARALLGRPVGSELQAAAHRAETGRVAAVDAAEAERRRIERDLHDGAQQRLVALAMDLGAARQRLETDPEAGRALVAEAHEEAKAALREIRDLVRGIHPVILADRGLDAALSAVVARCPVPVELSVDLGDQRLPSAVESAAYFVVSESLTNVARHARATRARVAIARMRDRLIVEVRDDGEGGARPAAGTGLDGLASRVASLRGTMDVLSPAGGPTTVLVELPCAS